MCKNNFIIFAGNIHKGGWKDFYSFDNSLDRVMEKYNDVLKTYKWAHIVCLKENKIIVSSYELEEENVQNAIQNKVPPNLQEAVNPVSKRRKCRGCIENQPNQMAHMDYGGCLYYE